MSTPIESIPDVKALAERITNAQRVPFGVYWQCYNPDKGLFQVIVHYNPSGLPGGIATSPYKLRTLEEVDAWIARGCCPAHALEAREPQPERL